MCGFEKKDAPKLLWLIVEQEKSCMAYSAQPLPEHFACGSSCFPGSSVLVPRGEEEKVNEDQVKYQQYPMPDLADEVEGNLLENSSGTGKFASLPNISCTLQGMSAAHCRE